jgi:hypothetical protein
MMFFLASTRCGVLLRWVPTWTTRLCLRAAAEHRLAFEHIDADRLLHVDIRAGLEAAIICSACQWSGVPIRTMSRSFSLSISR